MMNPSFSVYLKAFGEETRRARKACGFTRRELAQLALIHENTIGALERGERDLNCVTQTRLLSALGCVELQVDKDGVFFTLETAATPPHLSRLPDAHAATIVGIMGASIRARRKEMDFSLEEVSRAAGLHRNSLWNFERGLVAPNGYSVFAIFQALALTSARADFLCPDRQGFPDPHEVPFLRKNRAL